MRRNGSDIYRGGGIEAIPIKPEGDARENRGSQRKISIGLCCL